MDVIKVKDNCKYHVMKQELDNFHDNLDEYYSELKSRLIDLINSNYFEKDIEFFITKMFKLDDKDDSEFNVISYIEKLKKFSDDLYINHKSYCSNELIKNLLLRIDKLNDKVETLSNENYEYRRKLDKISADLKQTKNINKIEFENLNINYNSNPIYLNPKKSFDVNTKEYNMNKSQVYKEKEKDKLNTINNESFLSMNKSSSITKIRESTKGYMSKPCFTKIDLSLKNNDEQLGNSRRNNDRINNEYPITNRTNFEISKNLSSNKKTSTLETSSIMSSNMNKNAKEMFTISNKVAYDNFSRNPKINKNEVRVFFYLENYK